MYERAYAKINVSLNVIGCRPDGYHELDMLMAPIGLYDALTMEVSDQTTFINDAHMPFNEKNTIRKAIELLRETYGFTEQFKITLTKRIPFLSGLAGGSSDAAAALRCVNRLLQLKLTPAQLRTVGEKIGADVAFFLQPEWARIRGIGEIIEPLPPVRPYQVLLIKPYKGVSTKWAYQNVNLETCAHPDISAVQKAFLEHQPLADLLGNSLEQAAISQVPAIQQIKDECIQAGYNQVLMSGSGSTVFLLTEPQADLSSLIQQLHHHYYFVYKTQIIRPSLLE